MRKVLGLRTRAHAAERAALAVRLPVAEIRQRLRQAVHDCPGMDAQRLQFKIMAASSARELWMLRSDLYDCIGRHHSQAFAVTRVNALLPCFDGWLPSHQLVRI